MHQTCGVFPPLLWLFCKIFLLKLVGTFNDIVYSEWGWIIDPLVGLSVFLSCLQQVTVKQCHRRRTHRGRTFRGRALAKCIKLCTNIHSTFLQSLIKDPRLICITIIQIPSERSCPLSYTVAILKRRS